MPDNKSVTYWISELQRGNREAIQPLWERYFTKIAQFAARKLRGRPLRAADEQDVALSAIHSALRLIAIGQYPRIADREDLWRLLMVITFHKALHMVRDECRQKRGGQQSVLTDGDAAGEEAAIQQILSREPTPQFAAEMAEQCERMLDSLRDDKLRRVAIWKMEGYSNEEIAAEMQCVVRTVERKLQIIRYEWRKAASNDRDTPCRE